MEKVKYFLTGFDYAICPLFCWWMVALALILCWFVVYVLVCSPLLKSYKR